MPADIRHLLCTGDALARNGNVEEAIKCYEQAAQRYGATDDDVKSLAVYVQLRKLMNAHTVDPVRIRQVDLSIQKLREELGLEQR